MDKFINKAFDVAHLLTAFTLLLMILGMIGAGSSLFYKFVIGGCS